MAIKLKNQHPGVQFAVFFSLAVGMIVANLAVNSIFFPGVSSLLSDRPLTPGELSTIKWFQSLTTIMIFLAPPLIFALVCDNEKPFPYIGLKPGVQVSSLGLILLLLVVIQPFAMLLSDLNQRINVSETLRKLDDLNNKTMARFLVMNSRADLLINFFVVALLPAFAEELFFRGGVQNILERWTRVPAIAIILSAGFFAMFHLSFFKFLPIFTLGLALGIIFYITRNLWYSIFFHFVNNSLALLSSYYATRNAFMKDISNNEVQLHWSIGIISLLLTIGLFVLLRRRNAYEPLENAWRRDVFSNHFNTPS